NFQRVLSRFPKFSIYGAGTLRYTDFTTTKRCHCFKKNAPHAVCLRSRRGRGKNNSDGHTNTVKPPNVLSRNGEFLVTGYSPFFLSPSQSRASWRFENFSAATQRFLATSTANPSIDGGFPTHAILGCIRLDRKYVTVSVPSRYFSKLVSLPCTAKAS